MTKYDIEFYSKENGEEPARDFILELDAKIRAKQSSNITRILYFFSVGRKIILTNGFVKKTKKTPKREIELAKKCRGDYERRLCNEQL